MITDCKIDKEKQMIDLLSSTPIKGWIEEQKESKGIFYFSEITEELAINRKQSDRKIDLSSNDIEVSQERSMMRSRKPSNSQIVRNKSGKINLKPPLNPNKKGIKIGNFEISLNIRENRVNQDSKSFVERCSSRDNSRSSHKESKRSENRKNSIRPSLKLNNPIYMGCPQSKRMFVQQLVVQKVKKKETEKTRPQSSIQNSKFSSKLPVSQYRPISSKVQYKSPVISLYSEDSSSHFENLKKPINQRTYYEVPKKTKSEELPKLISNPKKFVVNNFESIQEILNKIHNKHKPVSKLQYN